MSKHIPLISSGVAGPLGILHLPRLWQKASLAAVEKLHDDYPACGAGYDQMVLDGIGISRDVFLAYIKESAPTYPQLEKWVLEQKGGSIAEEVRAKLNGAIAGYLHSDETREGIMAAAGMEDTGTIRDAINLNNLDDWATFHKDVLSS